MMLDIRSIIFEAALTGLVLGLLLSAAQRSLDDLAGGALRLWARAFFVLGLGFLLLGLRNIVPDLLSIVLANAMLVYAMVSCVLALGVFAGARRPRWPEPLVLLVAGLIAWFTYARPDIAVRVVLMSLVAAVWLIGIGVSLIRIGKRFGTRIGLWVAVIDFAAAALFIARAFQATQSSADHQQLFSADAINAAAFAAMVVAIIAMAFGFLLICTQYVHNQTRQLAISDHLTGIPNRRSIELELHSELTQAARHGWPLAVLLIDLDHFKRINDKYGHPIGDRALQCVARHLAAGMRAGDRIGRYGGEEFLVILPRIERALALATAERICERVRAIAHSDDRIPEPLTVSIGLHWMAAVAGDTTASMMVSAADRALYAAKEAGRDTVRTTDPELDRVVAGDLAT